MTLRLIEPEPRSRRYVPLSWLQWCHILVVACVSFTVCLIGANCLLIRANIGPDASIFIFSEVFLRPRSIIDRMR